MMPVPPRAVYDTMQDDVPKQAEAVQTDTIPYEAWMDGGCWDWPRPGLKYCWFVQYCWLARGKLQILCSRLSCGHS